MAVVYKEGKSEGSVFLIREARLELRLGRDTWNKNEVQAILLYISCGKLCSVAIGVHYTDSLDFAICGSCSIDPPRGSMVVSDTRVL